MFKQFFLIKPLPFGFDRALSVIHLLIISITKSFLVFLSFANLDVMSQVRCFCGKESDSE